MSAGDDAACTDATASARSSEQFDEQPTRFALSGQRFIDEQQQLFVVRFAAYIAANGMSIIKTSSDAAARRTPAFYDAAAARDAVCASSHSSASCEKRLMRAFLYSFVG